MRLHPRSHVIDVEDGVLLCLGRDRMVLAEAADADVARRVLAALTSRSTVLPESARDLVSFLRIAVELKDAGFLVGEDVAESWVVAEPVPAPDRPHVGGRTVVVAGASAVAGHVAATLAALGARTVAVDSLRPETDLSGTDLLLACPPGPDLSFLDATSATALTAGVAHLPVFHLGDEGVIGPYGGTGQFACFRCWELRWLGLAPSTTAEVRLHAHLREGGWRIEVGRPPAALRHLAERAADVAVAALVAGDGHDAGHEVWTHDFATGVATIHRLEPHPGCGRCAPAFSEPRPATFPFPSPEQPADPGPLVDERLGAAALVDIDPVEAVDGGSAPLSTAHARFAAPHPEQVRHDDGSWAHGAAATQQEAQQVALAEALERYCGTFTPVPAVVGPYDSLGDDALWPPELPLYSPRQYAEPGFPFLPFDPTETLPWAWGYSLVEGRPRLLPQAAVRYGPAESRLVHECSSGVAAHTSPEPALLGAALEVVERDSLMVFWLNRLSPPLLEPAQVVADPFVDAARRELQQAGYAMRLADLTTDLAIPVVLAVAFREDLAAPALTLGAGASLDLRRAIRKALRELLGGVRGWQSVQWTTPEVVEAGEVRQLADHARAYYHPSWLPRASFLWSSSRRTPLPAGKGSDRPAAEQLACLVALLREARLDLLAVDLTTTDVARHGISVVRAVVPGLQPIGFGSTGVRLGGRRLYAAPRAMGYTAAETDEQSLNPDPHCFP